MPEVWYLKQLREQVKKIKKLAQEIDSLKKKLNEKDNRIKALEDELKQIAQRKASKKPKFSDYSLAKQERLLSKGDKFKSPGRRTKAEKLKEVTREEHVYPEGVPPEQCIVDYTRIVTHVTEGKKEVVLYHIYKKKWSKLTAKLPQALPRSEYGVEVGVILAFLVYSLGLSHDQARQILSFFCHLEIPQPQINVLLNQMGKLWKKEFDRLCDLILLAFVVYVDETGWKEGTKRCYTWLFKSLSHTVFLYGEGRSEEVLNKILPRDLFKGIGITDCYKMYEKYFGEAQKCWAHFLRKIIKLMLLHPKKKQYKAFFKKLHELFKEAKELKVKWKELAEQGNPLTEEQKKERIEVLKEKVQALCTQKDTRMTKKTPKDKREFVNLHKNLIRNLDDLFTFVLHEGVEPTNNTAEQALRSTARARNNYQTSKTAKGSKRRSTITSVLASLKQNLPDFSLKSVTEEIRKWQEEGKSLFQKQLETLQKSLQQPVAIPVSIQGASP